MRVRDSLISLLLSPAPLRLLLGPVIFVRRLTCRDGSVPSRVLVVRLDRIGDLVLSVPFLRELRANLPDSWITLVVIPSLVPLIQPCPYVNEVLGFQRMHPFDVGYRSDLQARWRMVKFAMQTLLPRRFDLAINARRAFDVECGTLLCYLSGAPRRTGYLQNTPEQAHLPSSGIFDPLLTDALSPANSHEVESSLAILTHLGFIPSTKHLELWTNPSDEKWAQDNLQPSPANADWVCFCPGGSYPGKQWSIDRFVKVAEAIVQRTGSHLVIVGGPDEFDAGELLSKTLPGRVTNLAGKATLLQTFAVLKRCRLYLGNDTGPMHLAAAAGIAVVEICSFSRSLPRWNINSPARFGPWDVPHVVLQPEKPIPPCTAQCIALEPHCILGVGVADVLRAISDLSVIGDLTIPAGNLVR